MGVEMVSLFELALANFAVVGTLASVDSLVSLLVEQRDVSAATEITLMCLVLGTLFFSHLRLFRENCVLPLAVNATAAAPCAIFELFLGRSSTELVGKGRFRWLGVARVFIIFLIIILILFVIFTVCD